MTTENMQIPVMMQIVVARHTDLGSFSAILLPLFRDDLESALGSHFFLKNSEE